MRTISNIPRGPLRVAACLACCFLTHAAAADKLGFESVIVDPRPMLKEKQLI